VRAGQLAKDTFPYFFEEGQGIRWKLTSAAKPIPGAGGAVNDDTLSALIVFGCIDAELARVDQPVMLEAEIHKLRGLLRGYQSLSTTDPLGWGLKWWKWQWAQDVETRRTLVRDTPQALSPSHASLAFRVRLLTINTSVPY
jgi:hypothetical protein